MTPVMRKAGRNITRIDGLTFLSGYKAARLLRCCGMVGAQTAGIVAERREGTRERDQLGRGLNLAFATVARTSYRMPFGSRLRRRGIMRVHCVC